MKILIINGPNLNMLGKRNEDHYGTLSLKDIEKRLIEEFKDITFTFYQSNIEGEIVSKIQDAPNEFNAIIINPGGYTHTSVAIKDALEIVKIPKIEVHLSNLSKREEFRQTQITTQSCDGYISGLKELGYSAAVYLIIKLR